MPFVLANEIELSGGSDECDSRFVVVARLIHCGHARVAGRLIQRAFVGGPFFLKNDFSVCRAGYAALGADPNNDRLSPPSTHGHAPQLSAGRMVP